MFTLDENISVLKNRGYKSLTDKSNVNKFNLARTELFYNSILFTPIKKGLFKFNSEKKVLIDYKSSCTTIKYKIPAEYINSKRMFLDFCIGMYSDKTGYCNATIAAAFQITERRVQQATSRNDLKGLFPKQQRKVLEFFPDRVQALKMRSKLKSQGIISSKPFQFHKDIAISLNTSNRIFSNVLNCKKGKAAFYPAHVQPTNEKSVKWFKPVFNGKGIRDIRQSWEDKLNAKILMFNESVYGLQDFINKHGIYA